MKMVLKTGLVVLLISFLSTSCATAVRVQPANTVVVTKLHHPKVVVHNNVRYYRSNGVWYVKRNRGYRVVTAPVGVRVAALPRGYKVVKVRGVKYYKHRGVYYKRTGRQYVVVRV
ncbi:DUF6515 family protein [Aquimarina spongiae]|uniref:Uncharacterized protein n=1 Tax=Aquimarina spongiae TaxID=570521 RepID=A0A1M6IQS8_9FLAO|nr:DUF6515 family protein [Aquimarina spongiae]SHJ36738.1 hypothetical protein SAMN04488508_10813 [Aquimarina spongiae]